MEAKISVPAGKYWKPITNQSQLEKRNRLLEKLLQECESQERYAMIGLKKLLDIRELLREIDASPALRERVDEIIGKDILGLGSIHGHA